MKEGDTLMAGQRAGDFVLPKNTSQKIAWIAGGIGITPFRSQAQYLVDKQEKRDVVLFYSASNPEAFAYKDVFARAESVGLRSLFLVTPTVDAIQKEIPDFKERVFYISGPNVMVEAYEQKLFSLGVPEKNVVTDYFPGF